MTTTDIRIMRVPREKCGKCVDYTDNGKCVRCGECCSNFLPMTQTEILRIHALVKRRRIKPHTRITIPMAVSYDATCPFLNGENRCEIYTERPEICRIFKCDNQNPLIPSGKMVQFYLSDPKIVSLREEFFDDSFPPVFADKYMNIESEAK